MAGGMGAWLCGRGVIRARHRAGALWAWLLNGRAHRGRGEWAWLAQSAPPPGGRGHVVGGAPPGRVPSDLSGQGPFNPSLPAPGVCLGPRTPNVRQNIPNVRFSAPSLGAEHSHRTGAELAPPGLALPPGLGTPCPWCGAPLKSGLPGLPNEVIEHPPRTESGGSRDLSFPTACCPRPWRLRNTGTPIKSDRD